MTHAELFPVPLAAIPAGWRVATQQEAVESGVIVRAWVPSAHTFHRADRSTRGRSVSTKRPVYVVVDDAKGGTK